jgi:hypothetical protein
MIFTSSLLLFLLPSALAANDWSKPCTSGSCSYEAGDGVKSAWSALYISGDVNTVSDITSAAGWEILGCDPNSSQPQDIRLVCTNPSAGCSQLFQGGAEDTIVRLPESCSSGPFARVRRTWVHEDQSLPPSVSKKVKRGAKRKVRGIALDFDFASISPKRGRVAMTVTGTNNVDQRTNIAAIKRDLHSSVRHSQRDRQRRGFFSDFVRKSKNVLKKGVKVVKQVTKVAETIIKAADTVTDKQRQPRGFFGKIVKSVKKVGSSVGKAIKSAAGAAKGFGQGLLDKAKAFNRVDQKVDKEFDLFDIQQNFPIFEKSISCPAQGNSDGFEAAVKVDVDVDANLKVAVGIALTGFIVPPQVDQFAITAALSGATKATFNLKANAEGRFDSGKIPLLSLGIPGLDFPGIITIGPSFSLNGQIVAEVQGVADMKITAAWDLPRIGLVFPPSQGQSDADAKSADSPVGLSVATNVDVAGQAEVHLIPRVDFGIKIFTGIVRATVFLDLDTAGILKANVLVDEQNPSSNGGCIGLDASIAITAGADASLGSLFSDSANLDIFKKSANIFEKCFGNQAAGKRDLASRRLASRQVGLSCPRTPSIATPVIDEIAKAI